MTNPHAYFHMDAARIANKIKNWLKNNELIRNVYYEQNNNHRNYQAFKIRIIADPELAKDFMLIAAIKNECKPLEVEFSSNYIP